VLLEDQYTVQWGHHNAEREKKRKTEPKEQTTPNTDLSNPGAEGL
jgi:hypothetical protein